MVGHTEDGIRIAPLFTRADTLPELPPPGVQPWLRGTRSCQAGWQIQSRCDLAEPGEMNRRILTELRGGAGSIRLDGGFPQLAEWRAMLDGVQLDIAPVYLRLVQGRFDPDVVLPAGVRLLHDPVGAWASSAIDDLSLAFQQIAVHGILTRPDRHLAVDGALLDDAGASAAEEIGLATAAVIDAARMLAEHDVAPEVTLRRIILNVTTNADFFGGIAKIRALRRLWARVGEVLEVVVPPTIHAVTSARMLSRYDPWNNVLRNTIACAAAGMGGADAVAVLPHDHATGSSDARPARIARNTQNILLEECRLGAVADPMGGSWYIEQLSDRLAQAAWLTVRKVEKAGGFVAACRDGMVEKLLAERRVLRAQRIATRQSPIVGISKFADAAVSKVPPSLPASQRRLPRVRDAQPFEQLRDLVSAMNDPAPVLVASLGLPAGQAAASDLAADLYAAVGLRTIGRDEPAACARPARLAVILDGHDRSAMAACARELLRDGIEEVHGLATGERPAEHLAGIARWVLPGQDLPAYLRDVVERLT